MVGQFLTQSYNQAGVVKKKIDSKAMKVSGEENQCSSRTLFTENNKIGENSQYLILVLVSVA